MIEKNLVKSFRKNQGKIEEFDSIKIALASPELIRSWSHGEVKKHETIKDIKGKYSYDKIYKSINVR